MPIEGLTDRPPRLPRIGTLRKGAPKPEQGNKPGRDLDHFRFDSEDELVEQMFLRAYGAQPKRMEVYLPGVGIDDVWDAWREEWHASGLVHRCNGRQCVLVRSEDGKTYQRWALGDSTAPACPCLADPKRIPCRPTGRLQVLLPGLQRAGVVVLITSSVHDIASLSQALLAYVRTFDAPLYQVPFVLSRREREISMPGEKGRVRRVKSLVHLEPHPTWMAAKMLAYQRGLEVGAGMDGVLALPSPVDVTSDAQPSDESESESEAEDDDEPPFDEDADEAEGGEEPSTARMPEPVKAGPNAGWADNLPRARPAVPTLPRRCTEGQRQDLWRAFRAAGYSAEKAAEWIGRQYNVENSADLGFEQCAEAIKQVGRMIAPS